MQLRIRDVIYPPLLSCLCPAPSFIPMKHRSQSCHLTTSFALGHTRHENITVASGYTLHMAAHATQTWSLALVWQGRTTIVKPVCSLGSGMLSLPISSLVCAQYLLFVLRDSSLSSETAARHAQRWPTQECGPIMLSHIIPSVHICKTQPWTCHLPAARVAAQCSTTLRGGNYIVL